jgi:hypothetical protein
MTTKKETTKKSTPKKSITKKIGPKVLVIETIRADEKMSDFPVFEKQVYNDIPIVLQPGDVRVIVLKDFNGMLNELREGDIVDMPERRFKSLSFRGLVKIYEGKNTPNKLR